jgi:hypothetical protein
VQIPRQFTVLLPHSSHSAIAISLLATIPNLKVPTKRLNKGQNRRLDMDRQKEDLLFLIGAMLSGACVFFGVMFLPEIMRLLGFFGN